MQKASPAVRSGKRGRSTRKRSTRRAVANLGKKIPDEQRFRVPPSLSMPKRVFLCCPYCGYDPSVIPDSGVCPKCGGHTWQRYTLSPRVLPGHNKGR